MKKYISYISALVMGILSISYALDRPDDLTLTFVIYYVVTAFFFAFQPDNKIKILGIIASLSGISEFYFYHAELPAVADFMDGSCIFLQIVCVGFMIGQSKESKIKRSMALITLLLLAYVPISGFFPIEPYESTYDEYEKILEEQQEAYYFSYMLVFASWITTMLAFGRGNTRNVPPPVQIQKSQPATPPTPPVPVKKPMVRNTDQTQLFVSGAKVRKQDMGNGTLLQGGKYKILETLGQGGFGITYLAMQSVLNRKVAIKEFFMKEHCERYATGTHVTMGTSGSRDMVSRFKAKFIKEAQTIAAMDNHHIVRIFDIFEENGTAYYVMEYLDGDGLLSKIPEGSRMDEDTALGYIRQVCDALDFIHKHNILHLDVKPGNILFRSNGEAVLIDFGISKHYTEEGGSQTSSTPIGISQGYAPLEQYQSGGITSFSPATDIYSIGATLYKLVTGNNPPAASVVYEDGLGEMSGVSDKFRNAICKAMEPRRKDRPQTIAEFLELLD